MDCGYLDFARLFTLHQAQPFFVTWDKTNLQCKRRYSPSADRTTCWSADKPYLSHTPLSPTPAPYPLYRSGHRQVFCLSDKAFRPACTDSRSTLQRTLAARTVLQMDQAASAHQSLLRHITQRGTVTNLGRHHNLYGGGHSQKELNLQQDLYVILQVLNVCIFEKIPLLLVLGKIGRTILKTKSLTN